MSIESMQFSLVAYNQLSIKQLYDLLQLRSEIFVVEQNCAYQDLDGQDEMALHLMAYAQSELIAYARIFQPTTTTPYSKIGRVVVKKSARMNGFGKQLMQQAMNHCLKQSNEIIISAQRYLDKFYTDLGFISTENYYDEDGIPHQEMIYKIQE